MNYQQLTEGKRYQISILLAEGLSQSRIAKKLAVHRSTISRELKRNAHSHDYEPKIAQQQSLARRLNSAKYLIFQDTIGFVELALSWE